MAAYVIENIGLPNFDAIKSVITFNSVGEPGDHIRLFLNHNNWWYIVK